MFGNYKFYQNLSYAVSQFTPNITGTGISTWQIVKRKGTVGFISKLSTTNGARKNSKFIP
jgi:hypothetical protein